MSDAEISVPAALLCKARKLVPAQRRGGEAPSRGRNYPKDGPLPSKSRPADEATPPRRNSCPSECRVLHRLRLEPLLLFFPHILLHPPLLPSSAVPAPGQRRPISGGCIPRRPIHVAGSPARLRRRVRGGGRRGAELARHSPRSASILDHGARANGREAAQEESAVALQPAQFFLGGCLGGVRRGLHSVLRGCGVSHIRSLSLMRIALFSAHACDEIRTGTDRAW